jgi:hypothetical protein
VTALTELHERAMRAYVRARIKDGWLPDGAARDAVETWGVPAEHRAAVLERLTDSGIEAQRFLSEGSDQ